MNREGGRLDIDEAIRRFVKNYRLGAYCDSDFYNGLIEVDCPPERLLAMLPTDVREELEHTVLDEAGRAHLDPRILNSNGFRCLYDWLSRRQTKP